MNKILNLSILAFGLLLLSACALSIREGDPLWRIPINNKNRCESINGLYMDRGILFELLKDSSVGTSGARFSTSVGFLPLPYGGLPSGEFIKKRRKFNDSAITEITGTATGWDIYLRGDGGEAYAKTIIFANSERVGCDANNHLVLRKFSIFSGSEGTGGSASASELVIFRAPDGSLKVTRLNRNWFKSMASMPREKESALIFPNPRN